MSTPVRIGDLLVSQGVITERQLDIALEQQKVSDAILGDLLIKLGFISASEFAQTIAVQFGLQYHDLLETPPEVDALELVPKDIAQKSGLIPLSVSNGRLSIGITNPSNIIAVDTVTKLTGKPPVVYMVDSDLYQETIEKAYFFMAHQINKRVEEIVRKLKEITGNVPGATIAELVNLIMMNGVRKLATDIHITPTDDTMNVFYRIDGVLQHGHCIQKTAHSGLVSRIKVLAELDIAEQRFPQDGSFTYEFLNKHIEVRVSTVPTIYGENLVMRLLAGSGPMLRLESLGLTDVSISKLRALAHKSYGMILVVGPTGSGKTTTLFAVLRELDRLERNILTVEDPVEYRLSFVKQTQLNEKAGYSFALAAKSFMRQDPDVMLLGEVRDEDTAQMAIRAAITGHLVLSTLHANDTAAAIPRLIDLKIDNFLLSSALVGILAQRLARKICRNCATEYRLSEEEVDLFKRHGFQMTTAWHGAGCPGCSDTGYNGRISICEILTVSSRIRQLIFEGASADAIMNAAAEEGMTTMLYDGIAKAAKGLTTIKEVLRVAG